MPIARAAPSSPAKAKFVAQAPSAVPGQTLSAKSAPNEVLSRKTVPDRADSIAPRVALTVPSNGPPLPVKVSVAVTNIRSAGHPASLPWSSRKKEVSAKELHVPTKPPAVKESAAPSVATTNAAHSIAKIVVPLVVKIAVPSSAVMKRAVKVVHRAVKVARHSVVAEAARMLHPASVAARLPTVKAVPSGKRTANSVPSAPVHCSVMKNAVKAVRHAVKVARFLHPAGAAARQPPEAKAARHAAKVARFLHPASAAARLPPEAKAVHRAAKVGRHSGVENAGPMLRPASVPHPVSAATRLPAAANAVPPERMIASRVPSANRQIDSSPETVHAPASNRAEPAKRARRRTFASHSAKASASPAAVRQQEAPSNRRIREATGALVPAASRLPAANHLQIPARETKADAFLTCYVLPSTSQRGLSPIKGHSNEKIQMSGASKRKGE